MSASSRVRLESVVLDAADTGEPGPGDADRDRFRVLIDPAGHPFCLCAVP